LAEVVDAAHANGINCYAVCKPFEGGLTQLPHNLPRPDDVPVLDHATGLVPRVDPFVAENPELRLRRRPETSDPGGPISTIRLVKETDEPTQVSGEDLSVLTSQTIADFDPYEGPVTVSESVEWRNYYQSGRDCRVITIEDLAIPEEKRFIVVRYHDAGPEGDFTNELGRLVELETDSGDRVLTTPGLGPGPNQLSRFPDIYYRTSPYLRHPEVREAVEESLADHHYTFETHGVDATRVHTLDEIDTDSGGYSDAESADFGSVAVMRGKPEYLLGNLSPAYETVRDHWLDIVRECIAAGVDGVNFRLQNHTRSHEHYEYGYNDPVCDRGAGQIDHAAVARRNGDAYTTFLRDAASLLAEHGCEIGVHLSVEIFADDERPHGFRGNHGVMHIPRNFDWQWKTWINEFADYVELRSFGNVRPWRRERIVDRIAATIAQTERSIPLLYQSDELFSAWETPPETAWEGLRSEVEFVRDHPEIDAFVLYETRDLTRLDDDGSLVGSSEYADFFDGHFGR